jgi:signal transduction histidine kinase
MTEPAAEPPSASAEADHSAEASQRLRRHLRDSHALLGLPALWRGRSVEQIAESLLDVLVSLLRVELAHLRLGPGAGDHASGGGAGDASGGGAIEFWHPRSPIRPELLVQPFLELPPPQPLPVIAIPYPWSNGTLQLLAMRAEVIDEGALVVVGAARTHFPTEDERFLLRSAVDQASVAMANARLYEQAQRAIGLRDEFVSVAAHELRTPMTSLRAAVQLLQRHLAKGQPLDPEFVDRHLKTVDGQSKRMVQLIVRLLDVSRMETGKLSLELKQVDLWQLTEMVVANLQLTTHQHRIEMAAPTPARPIVAEVDPLRLEQVLANLLDNAVKYSPEGQAIEVRIDHDRAGVRITVRDHGLGIPLERRDRIFDRFFQAHLETHQSGMGLGLFISREIVRQHGGDLIAEFPNDGGSCFVITLPLEREVVEPSADRG